MPDDPKLILRPMHETDLGAAMYIGREAMDWLRRSQGEETQPWQPSQPAAQRHLLRTDPEGAWIAEMNGVPVGYSMALVRGDIWFLAQLFVQPDQHGHGIGAELLRRAQDYGRACGARAFSVVASSSRVAHALYMRAGMFATGIGYRMTGMLAPLLDLPQPNAGTQRIVDCSEWLDGIAALDRAVFGAERRADHAFYLDTATRPGPEASFGLARGSNLLAYGYAIASGGFIAPLAAQEPEDQLPVLRMAAEWLIEHEVSTGDMLVLSHNRTIMRALLAAEWKSRGWVFLMTSEEFGQFDRYHPAGGTLL
jgi:GNAT superfamily N-acetyltransferase